MSSQVREVNVGALAAAVRDGAAVIDVREPEEYVTGHVPGARNVPLATVPLRARELAGSGPVYVICEAGGRSYMAAQALASTGVDAVSVSGGTSEWRATGQPVVTGSHES